jgi:hypothetical protein
MYAKNNNSDGPFKVPKINKTMNVHKIIIKIYFSIKNLLIDRRFHLAGAGY